MTVYIISNRIHINFDFVTRDFGGEIYTFAYVKLKKPKTDLLLMSNTRNWNAQQGFRGPQPQNK